MRLLLKHKIILLLVFPIMALMIAQTYNYVHGIAQRNEISESVIKTHTTFLEESVEIEVLTIEIAHLCDEIIIYASVGNREQMLLEIEELEEMTRKRNTHIEVLQELVEQYDTKEGKEKFKTAQESLAPLDALNAEINMQLRTSADIEKTAKELMADEFQRITVLEENAIEQMDVFNEYVFKDILSARVLISESEQSDKAYIVNTLIIGILILVVIFIVMYFHIIVPLNELTRIMQEISVGNYKIKIKLTKRSDEVGMLAKGIDDLLQYLRASIEVNLAHKIRGKRK